MSLREHEHRRSQHARRKHKKQQARKKKVRPVGIGHNQGPPLPDLPPLPDDNEVMTFAQWCEAASFSQRTGRRVITAPGGPVITRISPRRIGVTRRNHRLWLASRERA
jgi:hypothetical protein